MVQCQQVNSRETYTSIKYNEEIADGYNNNLFDKNPSPCSNDNEYGSDKLAHTQENQQSVICIYSHVGHDISCPFNFYQKVQSTNIERDRHGIKGNYCCKNRYVEAARIILNNGQVKYHFVIQSR